MKKLHDTFLIVLLVLLSSSVFARIEDEYKLVQERRVKAEQSDRELVLKREELEHKMLDISKSWSECAGGRWSVVWQHFAARLETARQTLEKKRVEVFRLKQDIMKKGVSLDKKRRAIEREYSTNRGVEYEDEFRDYMSDIEVEYLFPFEDQYLSAANTYLNAVEIWLISAADAVNACQDNDLTAAAVEAGLNSISKVLEAIEDVGKFLKKS